MFAQPGAEVRAVVIHINGMPGTGKLTVARILARSLDAVLADNHSIIDAITPLHPRGSRPYLNAVEIAVAEVFRQNAMGEGSLALIFTNSLVEEIPEDLARLRQIQDLAHEHERLYLQVLLTCDLAENQRRVVSDDRRPTGKLVDPEQLEDLRSRYTLHHPPTAHRLALDTTALSPPDVARAILERLHALGGDVPQGTLA